jgi:hypothetical protein
MSRLSTYGGTACTVGLIGFLAVVPGAGSAVAQSLNDVVRGLNSVINPNDARRLEDQAYQNGRSDEQRYWHNYRAGLEASNRNRRDYGPDRSDQWRYPDSDGGRRSDPRDPYYRP